MRQLLIFSLCYCLSLQWGPDCIRYWWLRWKGQWGQTEPLTLGSCPLSWHLCIQWDWGQGSVQTDTWILLLQLGKPCYHGTRFVHRDTGTGLPRLVPETTSLSRFLFFPFPTVRGWRHWIHRKLGSLKCIRLETWHILFKAVKEIKSYRFLIKKEHI